MDTLIYILKAHLLFLILGGIYHFTLRNEKNFKFNRIYLLAVYGVSIIAPLLDFKLFNNITFINPSLLGNENTAARLSGNSQILENNALTIDTILPWAYGVLASISLILFILKFLKSNYQFNLLKRHASFDYTRKVYWVEDNIPPFTFLNKTILPERLKNDHNREMIIMHEESHRKAFHFFDIIWVEILSSLLIFNPINKKIKKYVVENHEFLADDYACIDHQKSNYAELLIKQTLQQNSIPFVSYFSKPMVLNRLNMLKNNKKSSVRPFIAALAFISISSIFSCDFNPDAEIILEQKNDEPADKKLASNNTVDDTTIFSIVEDQAEPKEGVQGFYDAIREDLEGKYPQEAIDKGVEGVVYIQFVIERDGSLSNVKAVKGIGAGCDEVAVEILKNHGDWIPGKQDGKTVRSRRVIPIRFVTS